MREKQRIVYADHGVEVGDGRKLAQRSVNSRKSRLGHDRRSASWLLWTRTIAMILTLALCCSLLSACGREGSPSSDEPASEQQTTYVRNGQEAEAAAKAMGEQAGCMNALSEMTELSNASCNGDTYYRLQQNLQGIPVYGKTLVMMTDASGAVQYATGNTEDVYGVSDFSPEITEEQIEAAITRYLEGKGTDAAQAEWESSGFSDGDLVIYVKEGGQGVLALRGVLSYAAEEAFGMDEILLDAHTGDLLSAVNLFCYNEYTYTDGGSMEDVTADGQKREQTLQLYSPEEGTYCFADTKRKIELRKLVGEEQDSLFRNRDETGEPVILKTRTDLRNYANEIDALANIQIAYDYYSSLGHVGPDGKGAASIMLYTDWGIWSDDSSKNLYNNAGSGSDVQTLTTFIAVGRITDDHSETLSADLGVMAHEYTHSVICYASRLGGSEESAAINEGISDIFGELVEAWNDKGGKCDWIHGHRTIYDPSVNHYAASVADANNGDEDYAHGHSTVISHTAYLMSIGNGHAERALTYDELAELWYRTILLLPSDCSFRECRSLAELSAAAMGLSEEKRQTVAEAFDAVGITTGAGVSYPDLDYVVKPSFTVSVYGLDLQPVDGWAVSLSGVSGKATKHDLAELLEDHTLFSLLQNNSSDWVVQRLEEKGYQDVQVYYDYLTATDKSPFALRLAEGYYILTFRDNVFWNSRTLRIKVQDGEDALDHLDLYTEFGGIKISEDPAPFPEDLSLYIPIVQSALDENVNYGSFSGGSLHDLDGDGIRELILVYLPREFGPDGYETLGESVCSVYTLRDGQTQALLEKKALVGMAVSPRYYVGMATWQGEDCFAVYAMNKDIYGAFAFLELYDPSSFRLSGSASLEEEGSTGNGSVKGSYQINGISCSEAEYTRFVNEIEYSWRLGENIGDPGFRPDPDAMTLPDLLAYIGGTGGSQEPAPESGGGQTTAPEVGGGQTTAPETDDSQEPTPEADDSQEPAAGSDPEAAFADAIETLEKKIGYDSMSDEQKRRCVGNYFKLGDEQALTLWYEMPDSSGVLTVYLDFWIWRDGTAHFLGTVKIGDYSDPRTTENEAYLGLASVHDVGGTYILDTSRHVVSENNENILVCRYYFIGEQLELLAVLKEVPPPIAYWDKGIAYHEAGDTRYMIDDVETDKKSFFDLYGSFVGEPLLDLGPVANYFDGPIPSFLYRSFESLLKDFRS